MSVFSWWMGFVPCALAAPVSGADSEAVELIDAEAQEATDVALLDEAYVAELVAWLVSEPDPVPLEEARQQALDMVGFEQSLPWQTGTVQVAEMAALDLGATDRFVGTEGAAAVLEAWGNPGGQEHAGMIFAQGSRLFGPRSWGVVVDYHDLGWVDDADASSIDYDELLATMKAANAESNEVRRDMDLEGLNLVGWAETPRYDPARKVLYWARELQADSGHASLNYEVRVLGRGGVLSLNAVADLSDLDAIRGAMEPVRASASFLPGQTYADYVPGVDPASGLGIAALVAGGALAASKTGLLKGLLAMLIAGKKFVVIAVVAVVAFVGRVFSGGKSPTEK